MRLTSFSVQDYRCITKRHELQVGNLLRFIGPNNGGKSSFLNALCLGLLSLKDEDLAGGRRNPGVHTENNVKGPDYDWDRDYPVHLQNSRPDGRTVITLTFVLGDDDRPVLEPVLGSDFDKALKITIRFGKEPPRVSRLVEGLSEEDTRYLLGYVGFQNHLAYVPASRLASVYDDAVSHLAESRLATLPNQDNAQAALEKLAAQILEAVKELLPDVEALRFGPPEELVFGYKRYPTYLDDGRETRLAVKGSGFKCLAAIAALRYEARSTQQQGNVVLAIEEPEAHLHPDAIHLLRRHLTAIAEQHPVIVTTHSPIFADRVHMERNIIVSDGEAKPARQVKEVRESLGVHLSDNLASAYLVILVEGETDRKIVAKFLRDSSESLRQHIDDHIIAIEALGGANNLAKRARYHGSTITNLHAFLDKDQAGIDKAKEAICNELLEEHHIRYASVDGMTESELEDLLEPKLYVKAIRKHFGICFQESEHKSMKAKWSKRMKDAFGDREWEKHEKEVKKLVARKVEASGEPFICEHRRSALDSLVSDLEERIQSILEHPRPRLTPESHT